MSRLAPCAAATTVVAALLLGVACGRADEAGPLPEASSPGASAASSVPDELRALGYGAWDDGTERGAGVVLWRSEETDPRPRIWADDRSRVHVIAPSGETLGEITVPVHTQVEFARSLPGGRIITLSVDEGLTLFEPDGRLVWQVEAPCHHEVAVAPRRGDEPGSRLFAVALHHARPLAGRSVRFDEVAFFEEATGALTEDPAWPTWSTWEHRADLDAAVGGEPHPLSLRPEAAAIQNPESPTYDYFHLNGIAFDGPGTMAVCLRNVSLVAEVSLPGGNVERSFGARPHGGLLDWPHAPSFVRSSGGEPALLVFDNGAHRGWSRAVELRRDTGEITWEWKGTDERPLWSRVRGFAERLPNGNTLITESERGRALEVSPAGEVVWEFLNPETRGKASTQQRRRIYRITSVPGE